MKTILIAIGALSLAVVLASPASAQTQTANPSATQNKAPWTGRKMHTRRSSAPKHRVTNREGANDSNPSNRHAASDYEENLLSAAKFGSKHWWAIQSWQSGGSSQP